MSLLSGEDVSEHGGLGEDTGCREAASLPSGRRDLDGGRPWMDASASAPGRGRAWREARCSGLRVRTLGKSWALEIAARLHSRGRRTTVCLLKWMRSDGRGRRVRQTSGRGRVREGSARSVGAASRNASSSTTSELSISLVSHKITHTQPRKNTTL
jgi:hypothetical protein